MRRLAESLGLQYGLEGGYSERTWHVGHGLSAMILHAPARPNASPDQAAAKALYLLLLSLHGGGWRPRISLKVMCVVASAYGVVSANRLALRVSFSRSLHDAHRR